MDWQPKNKSPIYICKDSNCIDPKLELGPNANGPNNKFVERGYKRTRLIPEEKRLDLVVSDCKTQFRLENLSSEMSK